MSKVSMNNFAAEPEGLVRAQLSACERVIRSGWWILGKEVSAFEREWAQWLGLPLAVGCGNGLDAIEIGLRALNVGAGDEVITTPMTAFATVLAILRAGATPVLADIDPATAMLEPQSVSRCISPRTKAILLVHLYGQIGAVEELLGLAAERNVHLIEDCAQSHGARLGGKPAGSFGVFGAWSFYPTKNLGAIGDGGALTSASQELADLARSLRNYGQTVRYQHPLLGMNSRLDELQAAILRERLPHLNEWTIHRRRVADQYIRGIRNPLVTPMKSPSEPQRHVHHLFVVTTARREELQRHLQEQEIESLIHYPVPIHHQKTCLGLSRDPAGLKHAEHHAASCLSLPCHPGMTEQQTQRVIDVINDFRGT